MAAKTASIIIPTYSGTDTIGRTFDSILSQQKSKLSYELIVVIDGPNQELRNLVESYQPKFKEQGTPFMIVQFERNMGRLEARLSGAQKAHHEQLILIDDKIRLAPDFLKFMSIQPDSMIMPSVIEETSKQNIIAESLYFIRQKVYGRSWGQQFDDYYITRENFERSPKGTTTTTLKSAFVKACLDYRKSLSGDSRSASDDTAILKLVVDSGHKILRTPKLKVYYQPRSGLGDSIDHLFKRGPKFVDYYIRPGTRFFPALTCFYILAVGFLVGLILCPSLIAYLLLVALTMAFFGLTILTKNPSHALRLTAGFMVVGVVFTAGLMVGTYKKLART